MKRILFLNLTTFSQNGGIERFNKCFLYALGKLHAEGVVDVTALSLHDKQIDKRYIEQGKYKGFGNAKLQFVKSSIMKSGNNDVVFIGHINLSVVGFLIKILYPAKKVILITHGIEIWPRLGGTRKKFLKACDLIMAVSNFTKNKLVEVNNADPGKVVLFPNTIDPFFPIPENVSRQDDMRAKYKLEKEDFVIFTLTRLKDTELYKGYDNVIKAVHKILAHYPRVKYVIGGKYNEQEKNRILALINSLNLQDNVLLTGFIEEPELVGHYRMADMYIMPSKKEGFGIVFIEALVSGLPVIGGNADGTTDALLNGETGTLIDPDSVEEITQAILHNMQTKVRENVTRSEYVKAKTLENFSFERYKLRLRDIIARC